MNSGSCSEMKQSCKCFYGYDDGAGDSDDSAFDSIVMVMAMVIMLVVMMLVVIMLMVMTNVW